MTGAEMRAHRKALGLSQKALALRANISCSSVKYWEQKAGINPKCRVVKSIAETLGIRGPKLFPQQYARTGGRGNTGWDEMSAKLDAEAELQMAAWRQRAAMRAARRRVVCGARTRKDTPCRNMSEPGRKRCKFHGDKSTGPKTREGRAKIAEAQRVRWAKWRVAQSDMAKLKSPHRIAAQT